MVWLASISICIKTDIKVDTVAHLLFVCWGGGGSPLQQISCFCANRTLGAKFATKWVLGVLDHILIIESW